MATAKGDREADHGVGPRGNRAKRVNYADLASGDDLGNSEGSSAPPAQAKKKGRGRKPKS